MTLRLEPERDPFPVNYPFKTEISLHRLGRPLHDQQQETVFQYDEEYATVIDAKLDMIEEFPAHSICYLTDDLTNLESCLWQLAAKAAQEQPTYLSCTADTFASKLLGLQLTRAGELHFAPANAHFPTLAQRCYEHLQAQDGMRRLCVMLAVSLQEDLTLMRQSDTAGNEERNGNGIHADVAECLLVAIPTHWDPAAKLGQNFGEIHQRVADNERLQKAHPPLMNAMINKGPFVRYSWALPSSPALAQNPIVLNKYSQEAQARINTATPMALLKSLNFRVERQTFLQFPELHRGLFAIHIYQKPLLEKLTTQARVDRLADAIESMSPATRAYRAMTDFADQLVDALRNYRGDYQEHPLV